jgi:8-oxo-dGTP pyrophosphatase MutT (NUDIX family)
MARGHRAPRSARRTIGGMTEPFVPVPAPGEQWIVGAVIHDGTGRIFFQRRSESRSLFPGAWDLVGGHLEPGEGVMECLAREIAEETGWQLARVVSHLGTLEWTGNDGAHRHEIDYLVEVSGDLGRPSLEQGLHLDPRWVDRDEALALLDGGHASDAILRTVVEAAFSVVRSG